MINKHGILPLPKDDRDLKLGSIFPQPVGPLPSEYSLPIRKVKDQLGTDFCQSFAVTTVSEFQEGCELSPEYQVAKIKELIGRFDEWGADLRTTCTSATKFGSLEAPESPYSVEKDARDTIANWMNWSPLLDLKASLHKKGSYFQATGFGGDLFDNIKASLWVGREENRAVLSGALWRRAWTYCEGGIIPDTYEDDGFGHAFVIIGWKIINGKEYLILHLSNGTAIGDNGIFYMNREIANRELTYGSFLFHDMDPETARWCQDNEVKIGDNWVTVLLKQLRLLVKSFVHA